MSKSKGNTVSPDDYIKENGSDVFRMYLAFGFAYTEGGPWSDDGIKAISRFVGRVERLIEGAADLDSKSEDVMGSEEKELNYVRNYAIKGVTEDSERFQFNTSIARIMEFVNALYKYESSGLRNKSFYLDALADLLKLMAPFAPHLTEELWEKMDKKYSIFNQPWPVWDEKALVRDEIEIVIQLNGKIREKLMIPSGLDKAQTEETVMRNDKVRALVEGRTVVKVIVVPGRLVNIVVR